MKNIIKQLDRNAAQWMETIDARLQVATGKGYRDDDRSAEQHKRSVRD